MASTVRLDADAVASATFAAARRGYDPEEVRSYLRAVAGELARLTGEVDELRAQLAHRSSPAVDEASIAAALGEEAARLLTTARDASHQIRARAEEQANETVREAQVDAERLRNDADLDAAKRRRDATEESEAMIEAAKSEGREMLAEARAVRERMLDDIARRREKARGQLETLRASHERVLRSMDMATASLEIVASDLRALGPDVGSNANLEPSDSGPIPLVVPGVADDVAAPDPAPAPDRNPDPDPDPAPAVGTTAIEVVVPQRPAEVAVEPADDVDEDDELGVRSFSLGELPPETEHDEFDDDEHPHRPLPSADDLFARIRAARSSLREQTAELLGPATVTVLDRSGAADADTEAETDADADADLGEVRSVEPVERLLASTPKLAVVSEPQITAPGVATRALDATPMDALRPSGPAHAAEVVAARNASLAPIETSLARHLKRVLADEQNEVLDRIRRARTVGSVDDVVGSMAEQSRAYRAAIEPDLWAAVVAGAQSLETELERDQVAIRIDRSVIVAAIGNGVVSELVEPLRERLGRCIAETDSSDATDLARVAYREWKAQRIDAVAAQLSLQAFGRGAFAILAPGTAVCWVVDPAAQPCPDGDDNVLGGAVPAGSPFPTGHTFAPAYAGCRCMLTRP